MLFYFLVLVLMVLILILILVVLSRVSLPSNSLSLTHIGDKRGVPRSLGDT